MHFEIFIPAPGLADLARGTVDHADPYRPAVTRIAQDSSPTSRGGPVSGQRLHVDVGLLPSQRSQVIGITGRDDAATEANRGRDDEGVDGMT